MSVLININKPAPFINCLQVKYSPNANLYVTSSKDGNIKIWDGVSNKCINTFEFAHDGDEVCSVVFSRNAKVPSLLGCFGSHLYDCCIICLIKACHLCIIKSNQQLI